MAPARMLEVIPARTEAVAPGGPRDADEIARAARALVDAYGARAMALMQKRTRAVRRRGDAESAALWSAVAEAVASQLAGTAWSRGN